MSACQQSRAYCHAELAVTITVTDILMCATVFCVSVCSFVCIYLLIFYYQYLVNKSSIYSLLLHVPAGGPRLCDCTCMTKGKRRVYRDAVREARLLRLRSKYIWNQIPPHIRNLHSAPAFRKVLKTSVFATVSRPSQSCTIDLIAVPYIGHYNIDAYDYDYLYKYTATHWNSWRCSA